MHEPITYGLSLTLVGMGGTLLSLWLLALLMTLLKRFLPYRNEKAGKE